MTQPATTTSIPRGVPAEQPVELVAVTSRLGSWSIFLLAVIAATLLAILAVLVSAPPYVLVR